MSPPVVKPVPILLVALGGALGAVARFVIGNLVTNRWGTAWPWATFLINVSGCFLIAFFLTLTSGRMVAHEAWRYLFPIGFIGAYTTFSTYEWEIWRLVQAGLPLRALGYLVASTVAGFLAVWLAAGLARRF
jgi:CrcB protein